MLEILKKRENELLSEIAEQDYSDEDAFEIEQKVAEYKKQLIDEVKSRKEADKKTLQAKLEEVQNLISEVEASQVSEKTAEEEVEETETEDENSTTVIPQYL